MSPLPLHVRVIRIHCDGAPSVRSVVALLSATVDFDQQPSPPLLTPHRKGPQRLGWEAGGGLLELLFYRKDICIYLNV